MIKELRTKTDNELGDLISRLKVQLLEMRFKIANGEVEGVHKLKEIRKTIAKAMTVLSERNVKISFSTLNTQLIKEKDGKQQITSLSIVTSSDKDNKSNNKKHETAKVVEQKQQHNNNVKNVIKEEKDSKPIENKSVHKPTPVQKSEGSKQSSKNINNSNKKNEHPKVNKDSNKVVSKSASSKPSANSNAKKVVSKNSVDKKPIAKSNDKNPKTQAKGKK